MMTIPIGAIVFGTINGVPHRGIVERIDPDDTFGPRVYLTDGYSILAKNVQSWQGTQAKRGNVMDPNAALADIRDMYLQIIREGGVDHRSHMTARLAGAVAGLDQWLTRGGFPPEAWAPKPHAVPPVTDETLSALLAPVGTFTPPDPATPAEGHLEADEYTGPTFREDES